MQAAIAFLADYRTQNFVRKVVLDIHRKYSIHFFASLLPAHVSLKQPFEFEDLEKLENYFNHLATEINPTEIELDKFFHSLWGDFGFLALNVKRISKLRKLHYRINKELNELFIDPSAPFDGESYHFHMTVEMSKVDPFDICEDYYEKLKSKNVNLKFTARKLGLFYFTSEAKAGTFTVYKILTVGKKGNKNEN